MLETCHWVSKADYLPLLNRGIHTYDRLLEPVFQKMIGIGEATQLKDEVILKVGSDLFTKPFDVVLAMPSDRVLLKGEVFETDGQRIEQGVRVLDCDLYIENMMSLSWFLSHVLEKRTTITTYRSHDGHHTSSDPPIENGHQLLNPSDEYPAVRKVGDLLQHANTYKEQSEKVKKRHDGKKNSRQIFPNVPAP